MRERRQTDRIVAFVMAGGEGRRLRPLTGALRDDAGGVVVVSRGRTDYFARDSRSSAPGYDE